MTVVAVIGTQLGDEGKGKVVDFFSAGADVVARFQGGDNAGHTVVKGGEKFKLHLLPSASVRGKRVVIGNGCVVNPEVLLDEVAKLRDRSLEPDWSVAGRAHIIMPYHVELDGLEEKSKEDMAAGTTKRGIGPCYQDKIARRGIRAADLLDPEILREKLEYLVPLKNREIAMYGGDREFDVEKVHEEYRGYGEELHGYVLDSFETLNRAIDGGDDLLLEGAQGTHLDIDHGIYPFNTSSNTTSGGACTGSGIGPTRIDRVIGVAKAYLSRVGTGPLPTELKGEVGDYIVEKGDEYGTTTGRRRRVGWLDLPMLRYSERINGLSGLFLTCLDVLEGLGEVKVCTKYVREGEELDFVPRTEAWGRCEPVYETFSGWDDVEWGAAVERGYDELPGEVRRYVEHVIGELGVELYGVSVGPERRQTIVIRDPF